MPAEQLDTEGLDAEDLAALAEVSRKGYYHARPKSEAAPIPERLDSAPVPLGAEAVAAAPVKRTEFDDFQRKWDKFDSDEAAEVTVSGGSVRVAPMAPTAPAAALGAPSPAVAAAATPPSREADETVVAQLLAMGFDADECRAAAVATGNRVDLATDYILSGKAAAAARKAQPPREADAGKVAQLLEMGMPERRAKEALAASGNDLERALEHICAAADRREEQVRQAGQALEQLQYDVAALESGVAEPDAKRLRCLEETVTQTSCSLDGIDVDGDESLRGQRRAHLDMCNALDARIAGLRGRMPTLPAADVAAADFAATDVAVADVAVATEGSQVKPAVAPEPAASKPEPDASSSEAQGRIAEAERLRALGNESFKAQDFESAAKAYKGALELDAENVAILSNLAAAEIKLGSFEEAVAHADAANLYSGGFSAKALFRKGQALEGLSRHREAAEAYGAALAIERNDKQIQQRHKACREEAAFQACRDAAAENKKMEEQAGAKSEGPASPVTLPQGACNGTAQEFLAAEGRQPPAAEAEDMLAAEAASEPSQAC